MIGRDSRHTTVLGRMAIGLLVGAVALLLPPVAGASPESDAANAAIAAAWDGSGGDGGPLGPRQGDVYAVGNGFAQNFAGGKIFFTPDTGAHIMRGAILEKYESLGGPADSDLGFPTMDDGPGRAPGSFNVTFSASDKPVIFWTQDTGARVVRGPINAAWDRLGGSTGPLGVPADDETYRGDLITQKFTGGEITYNTRDKTFTTVPPDLAGQLADVQPPGDATSAINAARRAAGGPLGPLGAAEGPPYPIGKDGLGQNFAGGKIFYSPATGARVVTGQVLSRYESLGGPEGDLGFPIASEADGGLPTASRMARFAAEDKPVIFWTPDHGAVLVRGAMSAAWDKLGGAQGALGAPMADRSEKDDVVTQRFTGGVVSWNRSTGEFTTEPRNLAAELAGLEVPAEQGSETPGTPRTANSGGDRDWFTFSWWWLLAIVPVLILVGLVAFAALRNRRRLDVDRPGPVDDHYDDTYSAEAEQAYSTLGSDAQTSGGGDRSAAMFADRYATEGLGALSAPGESGAAPSADPWEASSAGFGDSSDSSTFGGEDPDNVDTAPTRIPTSGEADIVAERLAAGSGGTVDEQGSVPEEGDAPPDESYAVPQESGTVPDGFGAAPEEGDLPAEPTEREPLQRDPLTDTGRHAKIVIDEPEVPSPAFRLPFGDSGQAPEGYPIKADTQSGRYWLPTSADYDEVRAEIWFSSEDFARTNGFVRAD
ncbi:hypothetical protein AU193_15480 [Mycobacterium sp. GA-1285]|uniref:LGFP repeat-containing protein n=1 Tax=Mycobacterium sp. GA-1285 TaxID=1772282 RepID=UPI000749ADF3|nr:hypothetical protein [Mycobacterium sp. GA-1285]KUI11778.1 hypothetical protein AU193_15480 [Mycobacterium sp. GA-1285]